MEEYMTHADNKNIFFITNKNIFNDIVKAMARNLTADGALTRHNANISFSCKNTQFLFISLCFLNHNQYSDCNQYINELVLNNRNYPIKSSNFENIIQQIGLSIANLFTNLKPSPNPIKNGIANQDDLTNLICIKQLQCELFAINNTGKYIIYPLCLYKKDSIDHYFTLIYNNCNKKYYIFSSYGSDNICVMNNFNYINKKYFEKILFIFANENINKNKNKNAMFKFVKIYFLPKTSNELIEREMEIIKKTKIGIINNYFNILHS